MICCRYARFVSTPAIRVKDSERAIASTASSRVAPFVMTFASSGS